jgi:hypothetical protein
MNKHLKQKQMKPTAIIEVVTKNDSKGMCRMASREEADLKDKSVEESMESEIFGIFQVQQHESARRKLPAIRRSRLKDGENLVTDTRRFLQIRPDFSYRFPAGPLLLKYRDHLSFGLPMDKLTLGRKLKYVLWSESTNELFVIPGRVNSNGSYVSAVIIDLYEHIGFLPMRADSAIKVDKTNDSYHLSDYSLKVNLILILIDEQWVPFLPPRIYATGKK